MDSGIFQGAPGLAGRSLDSRTAALSVWGSYVTWKYCPCQNSAEAQPPRSFPKGEEVMDGVNTADSYVGLT